MGPNGPFTAGRNVHYIGSLCAVKNNFGLFASLLLAYLPLANGFAAAAGSALAIQARPGCRGKAEKLYPAADSGMILGGEGIL